MPTNEYKYVMISLTYTFPKGQKMGFIKYKKTFSDQKDIKKSFESILQAADNAQFLLTNLKSFAQKKEEQAEKVNTTELIDSALSLCKHHFVKNNVTVKKNFPPIPLMITGYKFSLMQVLLNMIVNSVYAIADARKTDPNRKGTLEITISAENNDVQFTVADNGCGISEEDLKKIFEPLFTTKGEQGCGLGLSISNDIITNKHHGTIAVTSTVGTGTTFKITLPEA